jgi:predicted aminopeptidase
MGSRSISNTVAWGAALFALSCAGSGCSTASYLYQAGKGQISLFNHERPIGDVIKDERTPTRIKVLLEEIPSIKKFAETNGIKPTKNYQDYVQLDRTAAVYVVSACASLKFESKEWGFPIVGTFPYLGYFDLPMAKEAAQDLRKAGWDVDLRGARAYSTLGWFRDPVLSSMIPEGDEAFGDLANVVIHESVHATLYISGQAYFNESLANFVAGRLAPVYITEKKGPSSPEIVAYEKSEKDSEDAEKLLHDAYERLAKLYDSPVSDPDKLEEKKKIYTELQAQLGWKREITNATLVQYKEYNEGTPAFDAVYKACGSDWRRFLRTLGELKPESFSQSQQSNLDSVLLPMAQRCADVH